MSFMNDTLLKTKKYSPEILMGVGIAGMIGTVVLASKATLRAEAIVDNHKYMMDKAKEADKIVEEDPKVAVEMNYNPRLERVAIWKTTLWEFLKLYGPSIALGSLSIAAILTSNRIIKGRYLGAVAAYNGVKTAYDTYRARVREELGEDADHHFRYGTTRKIKHVEIEKDEETGEEKSIEKQIDVIRKMKPEEFSVIFDENNPHWDNLKIYNQSMIKIAENNANINLYKRGHVFLNEVYTMLGFDHKQNAAVVGWSLEKADREHPEKHRIKLTTKEIMIEAEDGTHKPGIIIDFNIDGVIWDLI